MSPIACMKAYMVVGPTNAQPRFFRSLDSAIDSGEVAVSAMIAWVNRSGRLPASGSKRHT